MSGIAEAEKDAARYDITERCPQCGIAEGDVGANGKIVRGMKVAQAVPRIGVVLWCSNECRIDWLDGMQARLP